MLDDLDPDFVEELRAYLGALTDHETAVEAARKKNR
jgi:hypothetical protein